MFALGVALQLAFIRPLRSRRARGALAAGHLGDRARDRGRCSASSTRRPTARRSRATPTIADLAGYHFSVVRLLAFGVSAVILLGLYLLLSRTRLGRSIRATVQNPTSARLLGIDAARVAAIGFGISVGDGHRRGRGLRDRLPVQPGQPLRPDLAPALDRRARRARAASAARSSRRSLMGVIEAVFAAEISPTWSSFTFFIVLIAILLVRPQGLFGRARAGSAVSRLSAAGVARAALVFGALALFPFVFPAHWVVNMAIFTVMYAALAIVVEPARRLLGLPLARPRGVLRDRRLRDRHPLHHLGDRRPATSRSSSCRCVGVGVALLSVPIGWVALRTRAATFAIVTHLAALRRPAAGLQPARR